MFIYKNYWKESNFPNICKKLNARADTFFKYYEILHNHNQPNKTHEMKKKNHVMSTALSSK